MKRLLASLLSVALLAASVWGLRLWLARAARSSFLVLASPGTAVLDDTPVVLRQVGEKRADALVRLDGALVPVPGGAAEGAVTLTPGALGPGVHTASWEIAYLGRDARRAVFAFLDGPFGEPGGSVPCSVRAALSQSLFDAMSDDIARALERRLAQSDSMFSGARAEVRSRIVGGGLDVSLKVTLDSSSSLYAILPLTVTIGERVVLQVAQRGPIKAEVTGTLGALASLKGGGVFAALESLVRDPTDLEGALGAAHAAGQRTARRQVQDELDAWLPQLNRKLTGVLPTRIATEAFGHRLEVRLAPCGKPRFVPGREVSARFDAGLSLSGPGEPPAELAAVPGPVILGAGPVPDERVADPGGLVLTLTEDLVNLAVDTAWRSGALQRLAADPGMIRRVNARLAGTAVFRVSGVVVPLPPVVSLAQDAARVRVGEAKVRLLDDDDVPVELAFVADGRLEAVVSGEEMTLSAHAGRVRASCSEASESGVVRRPCFPDLLDELDRVLAQRGTVAAVVPSTAARGAGRLRLTAIRIRPGALDLVAEVRLSGL